MTKRSLFARHGRQLLLCATAALAMAGSAFAQSTSTGAAKKAATDDDYAGYSRWDVSPFIGQQWFQIEPGGAALPSHKFEPNVIFGERFDEDFSRYVGLEESLGVGYNRLDLYPYQNGNAVSFAAHNTQLGVGFDINMRPRTAKYRPFFYFGPGYTWFGPGKDHVIQKARGPLAGAYIPPATLHVSGEPAFVYGVGLKILTNRSFGFRFDLRGQLSRPPHFGLPSNPGAPGSLYIAGNRNESSLMATVGVILRMGYVQPAPRVTDVSQTIRVDVASASTAAPTISGGRDVCAGDDLRLQANASGFANPTYQWNVNGQPAQGATGAAFSVPTSGSTGSKSVTVSVSSAPVTATSAPFATEPNHNYHLTAEAPALGGRSATYQWMTNGQPVAGATSSSLDLPDAPVESITVRINVAGSSATSAPASFSVQSLAPPTINFAVSPSTVAYTSGPIALNASATASSCGGTVRVTYSGEGVSGNSFNPGSVSGFDMANRLREQTKVVTITATATDSKNQTASKPANVTVTLGPEARRLDDVVFQNMSSRVNNCGKRLLLEELTPMLRNDPGAKVILIGHRDPTREKNAKKLDDARVMSAAAVLSAGKGICPQLDLSRILTSDAGVDQTSTPRPALCGASTNVKERSGQAVKETDKNAEYRRVEIWVIPSGAEMPAGVNATPVAASVSKLGCPK